MNIKTFFSAKIIVHLFNGNADASVEVFGIINSESDRNQLLPEETVISIVSLGQILRPIVMRMLENGYCINNGKLIKQEIKV